AGFVLVTMAVVSFAGVPLTRRAADLLVILGLVVVGRIVAGGALLLAAFPDLGRPLARRTGGRIASIGIGIALAFPFLLVFAFLFGGIDTLTATGLTYSSYARRGFFELIAVAILAGGLLFAVELVVAKRTRLYVAAALTLTLATLVIVVSAAYRMQLYQLAYGWTAQRFYALAGIAWLGAGGACAALLVWRDATRWLLHAGGLIALAVAIAVNLIGPSA